MMDFSLPKENPSQKENIGGDVLSVEFLVKLRDGAQMIADATEEYLQTMAPKDAKTFSWKAENIKWETATGQKGEYEKSTDTGNVDWKELKKSLEEHKGKLSRDNLFYWLFQDGNTIGRKKRA